jgi:ABC-type nitrate/sulfonate/bicarbonate transport system permease component
MIGARLTNFGMGLAGILAIVLVWHLATTLNFVSRVFVPTPAATFEALRWGLVSGDLLKQAVATTLLMIKGWLVASAVAIVVGAILGSWPFGRRAFGPILEFMRPLPASAIIPVAIAIFGLTPGMVLGVVAFGSLWPALLATTHGFVNVEPRLGEVSRALGLSRFEFLTKIGLPNAVPDILAGMRLSLTFALILALIAEMLAGETGLGTAILLAGRAFHSSDIFAGLVLLSIIGLCSNGLLRLAERRLLRWRR